MSYYSRWGLIIGTSFFQRFLRENYAKGVDDLKILKKRSLFSQSNFACLLCGVGNAETARSFTNFVTQKNPKAKIFIIDLGLEQIAEVKKLVERDFAQYNIKVYQMNALDLPLWFKESSFDWIETDGFLEFFSPPDLQKLLQIWYQLLKKNGFITIRETASDSAGGSVIDSIRVCLAKVCLGIRVHIYTLADLKKAFNKQGFQYVTFPTIVPTFRRFTLVKSSIN